MRSNLESRLSLTLQGVLEHELHHTVDTAICVPIPGSHWPMEVVLRWGEQVIFQATREQVSGDRPAMNVSSHNSEQLKDGCNSQVKRNLVWCQGLLKPERNVLEIL